MSLQHTEAWTGQVLSTFVYYLLTYKVCNAVVVYQIADLANEDTPQMYTLCGRGPRSSLRVLRHGLEVNISSSYKIDRFWQ